MVRMEASGFLRIPEGPEVKTLFLLHVENEREGRERRVPVSGLDSCADGVFCLRQRMLEEKFEGRGMPVSI